MQAGDAVFDRDNPEWTEDDFARADGPEALTAAEKRAFPKSFDDDSYFHVLNVERPNSDSMREAYFKLLLAGERAGYRTKAGTRGNKRDLHFRMQGKSPYALTVNSEHILFYLREPSIRTRPSLMDEAERRFGSNVRRTEAGEVTIRLSSKSDADQISDWLF